MDKRLEAIIRFYRNTNRYWYNKYLSAKQQVAFPDIKFEYAQRVELPAAGSVLNWDYIWLGKAGHILTDTWVKWIKHEIERSGLAWFLTADGHLNGIAIVDEPIPDNPTAGAGNDPLHGMILLKDMHFIPAWEAAGCVLHERMHLWQAKAGLSPDEGMAYTVQQLFYLNTGRPTNLFKDNLAARAAIGV